VLEYFGGGEDGCEHRVQVVVGGGGAQLMAVGGERGGEWEEWRSAIREVLMRSLQAGFL
jgi:hypothetical protein